MRVSAPGQAASTATFAAMASHNLRPAGSSSASEPGAPSTSQKLFSIPHSATMRGSFHKRFRSSLAALGRSNLIRSGSPLDSSRAIEDRRQSDRTHRVVEFRSCPNADLVWLVVRSVESETCVPGLRRSPERRRSGTSSRKRRHPFR